MSILNPDPLVRAPAVRAQFNISNPTLCRWVKKGAFPKPKYLNGQRVWRESALLAFEDEQLLDEPTITGNLDGAAVANANRGV